MGFLENWDLSYEEINELLTDNPSLRSFVMGYAAEVKCKNMYFTDHPDVSAIYKPDDHDRTEKGDLVITYKGQRFAIEVKSVQTNSMKPQKRSGIVKPWFQCDASDARTVLFKDGSSVHTTALLVGEFDVLAVNVHVFDGKWKFVFAKNEDLPTMEGATRGSAKNYTLYQQQNLIKTSININNPPGPPFVDSPFQLFDELIVERAKGEQPKMAAIAIEEE